jgi:quercetin dioxygenase-like cupin family protein
MTNIQKLSWKSTEIEKLTDAVPQKALFDGTLAQLSIKRGGGAARHSHTNEEYASVVSGSVKYVFDDREIVVRPGEVLVVPPNVPHWVTAVEDSVTILFFSPSRQEQIRGEVQYLRRQGQHKGFASDDRRGGRKRALAETLRRLTRRRQSKAQPARGGSVQFGRP